MGEATLGEVVKEGLSSVVGAGISPWPGWVSLSPSPGQQAVLTVVCVSMCSKT